MKNTEYRLGAYLQSHRKRKGLSLQEIHNKTRIRPEVLRNIEKGEELPASAYLKGFIRVYSSALGLDPDEVIKEFYKPEPDKKKPPVKKSVARLKAHKTFIGKKFVPVFLILGLLAFFVFQNFNENPSVKKANDPFLEPSNPPKAELFPAEDSNRSLHPEESLRTDGLLEGIKQGLFPKTLMIQSMENALMYFKVDTEDTVTKSLEKNIWYVIKAKDKIYIRLDGRAYLNLVHEGRLIAVFSEKDFERTF